MKSYSVVTLHCCDGHGPARMVVVTIPCGDGLRFATKKGVERSIGGESNSHLCSAFRLGDFYAILFTPPGRTVGEAGEANPPFSFSDDLTAAGSRASCAAVSPSAARATGG